MTDTSPEITKRMIQLFNVLTPQERVQKGFEMFEAGKKFAEAAVKLRQPQLSGRALKVAVFRWMYQRSCPTWLLNEVEQRELSKL